MLLTLHSSAAARRTILGAGHDARQQNLDKISLTKVWLPTPDVDINVSILLKKMVVGIIIKIFINNFLLSNKFE